MATADQLKALLKSYSEGDSAHFVSVAMQIASHEARSGKGKLAVELRELIDSIKKQQATGKVGGAVPIARPSGELAEILLASYPSSRLSEMVLSDKIRKQLERVIHENTQRTRLREHGLSPRRKLLLIGPPGCGKTMTARVLAGETKLPLFSIQLHGLITKFMGETAAKLYIVFQSMQKVRGVYLFDEFDAIGGHRSASNDVGEIRRVLNSFLQFLETDDSDSIIIGATNYVDLLDRALFRRFDDVIDYDFPKPIEIINLIKNRLALFKLPKLDVKIIEKITKSLSHSEVSQACDDAAKTTILDGKQTISEDTLLRCLEERKRQTKQE